MKISDVKMEKAGRKPETASPTSSEVATQKVLPSVSSYNGDLPGMEDMEVGNEYLMVAHVKCTRKEINENEKDGKKIGGAFDILDVGFKPYSKKSIDDMDMNDIEDAQKDGSYPNEEED